MSHVLIILKNVRALLSDPRRWTKDVNARDAEGKPYGRGNSGEPVCWCLYGAIQKVANETIFALETSQWQHQNDAELLLERTIRECCDPNEVKGIATFNDHRETTHERMLAMLDTTIAKALADL